VERAQVLEAGTAPESEGQDLAAVVKEVLQTRPYIWSDALGGWLEFVEQPSAAETKGRWQVTPASLARIGELHVAGWTRAEIVERVFGLVIEQ